MRKSGEIKIIIVLITFGILFAFSPIFFNNPRFIARDHDKTTNFNNEKNFDNLKISAVSGKIHIDGNSGWVDFRNAGNCTGSGTFSDPYVIKNLEIDGGGTGVCIWIQNSDIFFRIEKCTLYNNGTFSGIFLDNVSNGRLEDNFCTSSSAGITLISNSHNNTITGNTANNNDGIGIGLSYSNNNTIIGNIANSNGFSGIALIGSNNNTLSGNSVSSNYDDGIDLDHSDYNSISGNTANSNMVGIRLSESNDNSISGNTANSNVGGIYIDLGCNNNTITQNMIKGNSGISLTIKTGALFFESSENSIFLNCFIDNGMNAYDEGVNNYWDNGIKGNYWDDYNNTDSDGDGIGDVPYNITGPRGSQDRFPLMTCPIPTQDGGGFPLELIIITLVISGGAVIGLATLLLIKRKRKRIE